MNCITPISIFTICASSLNVAAADTWTKRSVVIHKASPNVDGSTLEIIGRGFSDGKSAGVWLADQQLHVLSVDSNRILTALPTDLEPADYLLTVKTGRGSQRVDRFNLTIPDAANTAGQIVGFYTIYDDPQAIDTVAPGEYGSVRATCAPGDYAVSGSYVIAEASEIYSPDFRFRILGFLKGIDQTSPHRNEFWSLDGYNESPPGLDAEIYIRITCADVAD